MDDLLTEFLTETSENLAVLDVELVKFEQEPDNKEILGNIFRLVHTIKGTCGFLGLPRLESVAHAGENVLGKFRDGELEVTPEAVTLILKCLDCVRDLLGQLEETGQEPEGDDQELIDALNAYAEGGPSASAAAAPAAPAEEPAPAAEPAASGGATPTNEFGAPVAAELLAEVEAAAAAGIKGASQEELDAELAAEREAEAAMAAMPATNEHGAPVAQELLAEVEAATAAGARAATEAELKAEMEKEREAEKAAKGGVPAPAPSKEAEKKDAAKAGGGGGAGVAASSIRVNVDVLEDLMTLVSELVLTRNQLLQMVRGLDDSEFTVPLQRLSHITTDLQEGVMKTRMQPIGNAWAKLPRIVRDLAVESGKKIELVMLGAETELDRQVLELIKDPLTHMVRNSADHGLENIEGRKEVGKPETGTITLNAFHEGGHIIIEIADDGRGLNIARIKQKALENGLTTEADLEGMTDQQVGMFIFKAGFSTAEKITNVSGRGVGMDVVRTNIEKIGGTVELKTTPGKGSTFTIKIPLTLAIVSALIVECAGERFAVPQISVLELVRASAHSENAIEMINESAVLRLRDRLLPLISLRELLRLQEPAAPAAGNGAGAAPVEASDEPKTTDALVADAIKGDEEVFIVVTQVGSNTFGIIVDRVFDTEEIVVKPVAPILRDITFYSGNTILGDGSVIMILDPNGIAEAAGEMDTEHRSEADIQAVSTDEETTSLLVFRAGGPELKAVPLALVARLEEVDMAETETSHGQVMVQYREQLMPLIPFSPGHQFKESGRQPILVFTDRERSMGLVVDEIVDIVDDRLKIELKTDLPGLIGSAVIAGKATDVIDAGYFLTQAFSDWFGSAEKAALEAGPSGRRRALLIDDSPFFRNLLAPLLSVAGWQVTALDSAQAALDMRDRGAAFDVIISDIEMPGMNGFEFANEVRRGGSWEKVPMVALSAHATSADFERGRDAGFNDYVAKFDREALVSSLAQTVAGAAAGGAD
ncbi:MAG: hybrid sensor histidine kinase/response regulator [Rhodospirillaceae bacterium]|nr:hybrid sensor histidine kinase/response regulator [Rhodospirillaceae bacterium]